MCHGGKKTRMKSELNLQHASPLIQLPVELRLKILRMLLKSPTVLPSKRESLSDEDYDKSVQLSGQVVRVCRMLQPEAELVLYNENVLSVYCEHRCFDDEDDEDEDEIWAVYCHILDGAVELPYNIQSIDLNACDIETQAYNKSSYVVNKALFNRRHADRMLYLFNSIGRFQNLQVRIEEMERTDVFITCRVLQELVEQKKVRVSYSLPIVDEEECLQLLKSFLPWRCNSISFDECCPELTQEVVKVVTSNTLFENDPLPEWYDVTQEIAAKLRTIGGADFHETYSILIKKFSTSLLEYDMSSYASLKKEICTKAAEWNTSWALNEPEAIRKRAKTETANIQKVERKMAKVIAEVQKSYAED